MADICFVNMPFAAIQRPSIALGLMRAILRRAGMDATIIHANLACAEWLGAAEYSFWTESLRELAFSPAAFPSFAPDVAGELAGTFRRMAAEGRGAGIASEEEFVARAMEIRAQAPAFVDRIARRVVATGARVVGCTSMYWQQTASLALLRRVRELDACIVTILGGANCEGGMGLAAHRNFPWVDYVVSGEADDFIAPLCRAMLARGGEIPARELPPGVFGPAHRRESYPAAVNGQAPRAISRAFRESPTPDYDDYFAALAASPLRHCVSPGLLVESARGCWWGAVHQCKFCGISEEGMVYQSRPPENVLADFDRLQDRHGVASFEVTDNILDLSYFRTVLPQLAASPRRRTIFWETKANLKRPQVELLAQAGVRWIQPGIESLDSRLLSLMDKGVQASQNVLLLRWCREEGIRVIWNLLFGFPGEEDQWYADMARLVPRLEHLQPPRLVVRLRYDRFSVYERRASDYGLRLRPTPWMALAYPLPAEELHELTYYFDDERDPVKGGRGVRALVSAVARWNERFWRGLSPFLGADDDGETIRFVDTRACAASTRFALTGVDREVYLACDGGVRAESLRLPGHLDALARLNALRVVAEVDGKWLALALTGPVPALPSWREFPGGYVSRSAPSETTNRSIVSTV